MLIACLDYRDEVSDVRGADDDPRVPRPIEFATRSVGCTHRSVSMSPVISSWASTVCGGTFPVSVILLSFAQKLRPKPFGNLPDCNGSNLDVAEGLSRELFRHQDTLAACRSAISKQK
jgi:hypothetical protein